MTPRHLDERGKQEGAIAVVPKRPAVGGPGALRFSGRGEGALEFTCLWLAVIVRSAALYIQAHVHPSLELQRVPHWVSRSSDFSEIEATAGLFRNAPHRSSLPQPTVKGGGELEYISGGGGFEPRNPPPVYGRPRVHEARV
ncbi:hypothetical protein ANAPC5_01480 [Anaplasma phagocytophilum]|nr:hypothetical protein ANAPC5_01480 [Anaplasma phagocytophilum]